MRFGIEKRAFLCLTMTVCLAMHVHSCQAHNSGVVVQSSNGKLVTGFIDEASLKHTITQRAFPVLMPSSLADDFPGFLSQGSPAGGNDPLAVGRDLYWDLLPMHNDRNATNLLYWDAEGSAIEDVEFGPVPADGAALSLYTEDLSEFSTANGDNQLVAGNYIGKVTTDLTTPLHAHLWSFLGSTSTVPEGIYLSSIRLRMEGYENSAALYVAAATGSVSEDTLYDLALPWIDDHLDALVLPGDFDFDGDVDGQDFLGWQRNSFVGNLADWESNYPRPIGPAIQAVPEPEALLIGFVLFSGVVLTRRRG